MTLQPGTAERIAIQGDLLRTLLILAFVAAVVIAAAVAFDWTLTGARSFDLTPDPAGTMPF